MTTAPSIVWFRDELRLEDHPALAKATVAGGPVLPVHVWPERGEDVRGGNQQAWALRSLEHLDKCLRARGSRLLLLRGRAKEVLPMLCRKTGATRVFLNHAYDSASLAQESAVADGLRAMSVELLRAAGNVLHAPVAVQSTSGRPFRVFTPFWKHCQRGLEPAVPVPAPDTLAPPPRWPASVALGTLAKELRPPTLHGAWQPGEAGAWSALHAFLADAVQDYHEARDRPDRPGTSRLSPHLHFGEISARQVFHAARATLLGEADERGAEAYLRQLYWREFAIHLLFHEPQTTDQPLAREFNRFPWKDDPAAFDRWKTGTTGYPYIDAAMRELLHTGWMHNRARMAVASFLVKDLLIPWQRGAEWFWQTLVDADPANNTLGWQWVAGCGADAAPFFRIFNPVKQGEKFDPQGVYIRKWVPELERLPDKHLHAPWLTPPAVLQAADIRLGKDYPLPIVDHANARDTALNAYRRIRA